MNKLLLLLFYTLLTSSITAQKDTSEVFYDHFGNELITFSDSTYIHKFRTHPFSSWSTGKISSLKDTLFLITDTIYDTVRMEKCFQNCSFCGCITIDSLVLSIDLKPNRISLEEYDLYSSLTSAQLNHRQPNKLYRKKNKLLIVLPNGKLFKTKQKPLWSRRKHKPHYYLIEP